MPGSTVTWLLTGRWDHFLTLVVEVSIVRWHSEGGTIVVRYLPARHLFMTDDLKGLYLKSYLDICLSLPLCYESSGMSS